MTQPFPIGWPIPERNALVKWAFGWFCVCHGDWGTVLDRSERVGLWDVGLVKRCVGAGCESSGICGWAIGSCECEFVAAFLCLVGGGLSIHPFVNSVRPKPGRFPRGAGHRVGSTTLSRTTGRSHQTYVRAIVVKFWGSTGSELRATSNWPAVARAGPLERGPTKTIPQLLGFHRA